MSGHSKWHTIKHKKGAADAKRGKVFTRIIKELTVAARAGGGDPDMNPRLRTIIADAKAQNMPSENIKRAIRRGTGEEPGVSYEEAQYEAYGPGGAAVIMDVLTDNKNRTVGELRHLLTKNGGNLAETNAVAWMFTKRGYIVVPKSKADEETLMSAVLEAGGDDLRDDEDNWEVLSPPEAFQDVLEAVKKLGIEPAAAEISLQIQDALDGFDYSALGLEGKGGRMRIGAHYGPAYRAIDHITGRLNFYGNEVSKAARIEPVTPTGAVFVTEPFAAILALEAPDRFDCRYVGRIQLAKGYGSYPMYRLTRAD